MASASGPRGVAVLVVLLVAMAGTASLVHACPSDPTDLEVCQGATVSGGGNPNSYPGCCPAVVSWGLDCLCYLVTEYASAFQSAVDINKCLAMPAECGLSVPANYVCDGYSVPPTS